MLRARKRAFRLLGAFAALSLALTACGGDDDGGGGGGDETTSPTETGSPSDASVGLVIDIGGLGDQSFNDAANRGLTQAADEFGIETKLLEPSAGGENREQLLRLLADEGYPFIIGNGFLFEDSIKAVSTDYPDTTFAIVDAVVDQPNVASLTFAEEQGSFLVGAAAGLKTKTNHIGFVGGVETPLIAKFLAGFQAGAQHVNPDVTVEIKYLTQPPDFSGFTDPAKGKEAALAMYQGGADIVYHAAGQSGIGVFEAAKEVTEQQADEKLWAIGVDSDQYKTASEDVKEYILTSMLKKVDVAVYEAIKGFVNGEDVAGHQVFDLAADGVGYSTSGGFIDDITDQLDELKQQIIDGDITVPTEPSAG